MVRFLRGSNFAARGQAREADAVQIGLGRIVVS
jgi:hypothetical protein